MKKIKSKQTNKLKIKINKKKIIKTKSTEKAMESILCLPTLPEQVPDLECG